jgi:hypothetical protein
MNRFIVSASRKHTNSFMATLLSFWPLYCVFSCRILYSLSLSVASRTVLSSQHCWLSHIATDGQSVSKSWCPSPSWAYDQIFITVWQLRSCFCKAVNPCQCSLSRVRVPWLSLSLILRPTVSRPVCLGIKPHLRLANCEGHLWLGTDHNNSSVNKVTGRRQEDWTSYLHVTRFVSYW